MDQAIHKGPPLVQKGVLCILKYIFLQKKEKKRKSHTQDDSHGHVVNEASPPYGVLKEDVDPLLQ